MTTKYLDKSGVEKVWNISKEWFKKSGYIKCNVANLSSYWANMLEIPFSQSYDSDVSLYVHSAHNHLWGLFVFRLRDNGSNNIPIITVNKMCGNIPNNKIKIFYKERGSTEKAQVWGDVGLLYGVLNYIVLSETNRASIERNIVTVFQKDFTSVQTQPSSADGWSFKTPSVIDLDFRNITANKFKLTNGTSSQFLKADGSVDSTLYTPLTYFNNLGDSAALKNLENYFTGVNTFANCIKTQHVRPVSGNTELFLGEYPDVILNGSVSVVQKLQGKDVNNKSTWNITTLGDATFKNLYCSGINFIDGLCMFTENGGIISDHVETTEISVLGVDGTIENHKAGSVRIELIKGVHSLCQIELKEDSYFGKIHYCSFLYYFDGNPNPSEIKPILMLDEAFVIDQSLTFNKIEKSGSKYYAIYNSPMFIDMDNTFVTNKKLS